jgi:outer membrane protein OmpA-like peptidoglycan-associated protein
MKALLPLFGAIGLMATASAQTPAAPTPTIPLCPGLTIVTAIKGSGGDYESIKTIESADANEVRMKYSSEMNDTDWLGVTPRVQNVVMHRTMLTRDLQTGAMYQQVYLEKAAETIPGATAIGTSAAVLRDLKTKGEAALSISNAYAGLELTADRNKFPNYYQYMQGGTIKKTGTARLPVLVNDAMVELPAIRAEGDLVGKKVEFFFLDDERNPLSLAFRIDIEGFKPLTPEQRQLCDTMAKAAKDVSNSQTGYHANIDLLQASLGGNFRCSLPNGGPRDTLRVVKIISRCTGSAPVQGPAAGGNIGTPTGTGGESAGAAALEKALKDTGKIDVYSIYFSFNSDRIRDESTPTLNDIAEVLRRHPDWKLQVNGHTDAIGGDAPNLDLSKRRAAAVKNTLVTSYKIDPGRLATSGFGKSQPKDTNDTLEGRAHNRRVELIRVS